VPTRPRTITLIVPIAVLVLMPGCLTFPTQQPILVQVLDAETHQPIAGAEARLPGVPACSSKVIGTTEPDGSTHLKAVTEGEPSIVVEAIAAGYMDGQTHVPTETLRAAEAALAKSFFGHSPPLPVQVQLYAEPRPNVELALPPAYRGQVRARLQIQDDASPSPGLRAFHSDVPASGEVEIIGPPVLAHAFAPDFRLRYADGLPLSRNAAASEIGYWWIKNEGGYQCFFVGTQAEYNVLMRSEGGQPSAGKPNGDGKRGGGGGGRGWRGGGSGGRGGAGMGGMGGAGSTGP
jgi:uncharacterized membrane protein YgcG